MFDHEFVRHAFVVLTLLAPACGLVGYFLVTRNEVFAGDALSHVGFTGALAALAWGVDQRLGLFAATIAAALVLGLLAHRSRADDTTIGILFMWILGLGVLCLTIFTTNHSASNSRAGTNVLFGSVFGITSPQMWQSVVMSIAVLMLLVVLARPLLFTSLDPIVAASRGVPVRLVSSGFLVLVALVVAQAVQVIGALLVLALIATPAATVVRLTANPWKALLGSALLGLLESWLGLTLAYYVSSVPPSFALVGVTTTAYLLATAVGTRSDKIDAMGVEAKA